MKTIITSARLPSIMQGEAMLARKVLVNKQQESPKGLQKIDPTPPCHAGSTGSSAGANGENASSLNLGGDQTYDTHRSASSNGCSSHRKLTLCKRLSFT
jgi:hypothetical protein